MNESDKKFIVVQNAQRVTVPMEEKQAQEEAARRNKILESTGQKVPENRRAQVKQNLCG